MRTIHKHHIPIRGTRKPILTGECPKVLAVGFQGCELFAWVEQSIGEKHVEVVFDVFMTGEEFAAHDLNHIDTVTRNGIVVHVYADA